jgi:23S rRNA pseudouridine1911/1915/1917 synthase
MAMHCVPDTLDGWRLDRALAALMPGSGLREVRRLIESGVVLVEGVNRPKGYAVSAGQCIEVRSSGKQWGAAGVRLVVRSDGLAALFKPAGLHTQAVAGRSDPALEDALENVFPGESPVLLNRLDRETSGLVLVALDEQGLIGWKINQDAGVIRKEYLLIAEGLIEDAVVVKNAIDSAHRRKVKVLKGVEAPALRWTRVEPLDAMIGFEERTVCLATILKGGRHQIRAHMAFIGHPVTGDGLYGQGGGRLYLHHFRISTPGFSAMAWPDWPRECFPDQLMDEILKEHPTQ